MSEETDKAPPDATPSLNQQIDSLNQTVLNLQALADRVRADGDFANAQTLSSQAVALSGQLNQLRETRRDRAVQSDAWQALSAHLDALNAEAEDTNKHMQSAENNVETAKTVISLVSKLATMV
jgi:DNA repair exonuclease SbcCD ATPase subunit